MKLSPADRLILELLRENSRRSLTEIAAIIGLSRPTVKYHLDKLIGAKVIRRFTIEIDGTDTARSTSVRAMFDIHLKRNACGVVYASIAHWSELVSAWSVSGAVDMRILLEAANQTIIEELRDRLARHPDVISITTSMLLKTWCEQISGVEKRGGFGLSSGNGQIDS